MTSVVGLTELLTINTGGSPVTTDNPLPVSPINVQTEFRESFETYNTTTVWSETKANGDIVQLDGNAASCSYLVISKDALTTGGETIVETRASFTGPFETAVGLSMSQRVLGQECALEFVSTDTPLPPVADIAIASISQSTTTLTVTTSVPHGLSAGTRIGIYGVTSDSRFNYPAVIVAAVVSTTSFTVTAGPAGTIASVTAGPYTNQGYVYYRPALGYAQEGLSEIFENASTGNASLYVRSDSGDALPSGTAGGNQSATCGSTASTQLISAAYTYAFNPSVEYRFQMQADKVQFLDYAVDGTGAMNTRLNRTSVVPTLAKTYKLRFRVTNDKGISLPVGKIVSAVKSASTVATITTASAHGLTSGDWIVVYGIRDQTNFANATTAGTITVLNSTQFQFSFGASATATSYGGMVMKMQGSSAVPGSVTTVVAQSATVTATELILVGTGTWTWLPGDYVNVYGVRDNSTGADLGVDGVYKVANVATTTLTLLPIGSTVLPAAFGSTNCGGTTLKRTDVRISYARIFQYLRERVEMPNRTDSLSSVPVYLNSGVSVNAGSNLIGAVAANNTYSLVTSTNLGASATFTQTAVNPSVNTTSTTQYNTQLIIGVSHTAGQTPGQLYLDLGTETSSTAPTTWFQGLAVPIPSNANWTYFSVPISTRYYRLRFVNGPVAQTNFRLSTFTMYNGGGLSGQLNFPQQLYIPISTTTIGISGVQTSIGLDFGDTMNVYKTISFTAYSDQASASNGFQIQVSRDNSNWRLAAQTTVTAATLTTLTTQLVYRYARVVYSNGAVAQTSFQMDARAEIG